MRKVCVQGSTVLRFGPSASVLPGHRAIDVTLDGNVPSKRFLEMLSEMFVSLDHVYGTEPTHAGITVKFHRQCGDNAVSRAVDLMARKVERWLSQRTPEEIQGLTAA